MIEFTDRQVYLINQENPSAFICVAFKDIYLTSHYKDLLINGHVYASTNMLSEIDPLQMVSDLERDLYTVKLSDSNNLFHTTLNEGYYGAPAVVHLGLIDDVTGEPDVDNLILIYDGIFESYSKVFDTSEVGSITCKLVFSNLMSSLDASDPYYTSKEFVASLRPNDTSFDQINEGTGAINLKWGKK